MTLTPTAEQAAAVDAFQLGVHMKLEAFAGTGKTSTLKLLAATTGDRGIYLAFNSSAAAGARHSGAFGRHVDCRTTHSFGYRWLAEQWGEDVLRERLSGSRLPPFLVAKHFGLRGPTQVGEQKFLAPAQIARLAQETVRRFSQSADESITVAHVPRVNGVDSRANRKLLTDAVLPYARAAWEDLTRPDGQLRFNHDVYLKMFAMTDPVLPADFVLLDEAQDTNPVVARLVSRQAAHAQLVAVGDACQAIYGWRGATDFLSQMEAEEHLFLTQSWRFGEAVAAEANKWLRLLEVARPVKGSPHMDSRVESLETPDAVLCRTNGEAVSQLMTFQATGVPACIVGGGGDFKRLAEAAAELQQRGQTSHPELAAFTSWQQVCEYVEESDDGADLAVAVDLIGKWGSQAIVTAIDSQAEESIARVTISTAHKAKGLEWGRVKIACDFRPPKPMPDGTPGMPSRDEMMLAYVAVTRARDVLDAEGLAWVNEVLAAAAARDAVTEQRFKQAIGRRLRSLPTGDAASA